MTTFDEFLNDQLKNPHFKAEYDALEPEFAIIQALIDARNESGLTQEQLSEKTGISQRDIARLENGDISLSIDTLKKLATGIGKQMKIAFV